MIKIIIFILGKTDKEKNREPFFNELMNYKSIFNLLGILLGIFSLSFIPPLVLTFIYSESGTEIFLYSFIFFLL